MTTISQVLARCAAARPDSLPDETKARWLTELDGRIYTEVTGSDEPAAVPVARWPEQADDPLLVQGPYQGLYELWLQANLEFALGNYGDYNDLAGRFETLYSAFRAHWRQTHRPPATGGLRV